MPSVRNGCYQKCSAGWPPPITFPFMSETLTLTPLPLFALHHYFSLHLFFPYLPLLLNPLPLHQKRKWQKVCLWVSLEKQCFGWLCCRECDNNLCPTPLLWGCLMPSGHEMDSVIMGLNLPGIFWTVEKDKGLVLCWGTESAGKIFAELFWFHQCWDDTFLFQREKYCFCW